MRLMVIVCVIASVACACPAEERKQPAMKVKAEDLSSGRCEIEGRLGKPYGTIIKVRAVWEGEHYGNPKGDRFVLRVTEVDGQKLPTDRQIIIPATVVKWMKPGRATTPVDGKPVDGGPVGREPVGREPVGGEKVEGRVFESGGYVGRPPSVDKILHIPARQSWYVFGFHSFLYFIDYSSLTMPSEKRAAPSKPSAPNAQEREKRGTKGQGMGMGFF